MVDGVRYLRSSAVFVLLFLFGGIFFGCCFAGCDLSGESLADFVDLVVGLDRKPFDFSSEEVPSESLDSENLVGNNLARISCFWVRNRTPTPTPTNRISKIEYFL